MNAISVGSASATVRSSASLAASAARPALQLGEAVAHVELAAGASASPLAIALSSEATPSGRSRTIALPVNVQQLRTARVGRAAGVARPRGEQDEGHVGPGRLRRDRCAQTRDGRPAQRLLRSAG